MIQQSLYEVLCYLYLVNLLNTFQGHPGEPGMLGDKGEKGDKVTGGIHLPKLLCNLNFWNFLFSILSFLSMVAPED